MSSAWWTPPQGYMIGLRIVFDGGEPVTIMLPLIFMPTFIRMLQEQSDELQAMQSAPRS